jgi:methyltransferase (TIGR00027 family)
MKGPSRTSILVAAARALGARERDPSVRNPDWMAEQLLGPEEHALLGPLGDLLAASVQPDLPKEAPLTRMLIVRTRFIDACLEAALSAGIDQVVMLGAGFDTRAYRFREALKGARVIELDHPDTQAVKIRRVAAALGSPPANLTYVTADLRVDDLGKALRGAGYEADRRTFFIWEGVTMYLPAEAVRSTLGWVASNAATGSAVVFDYTYMTAIEAMKNFDISKLPAAAQKGAKRFMDMMSGEPWIFGLPDGGEREFLAGVGLGLRKMLGLNSPEAVETYLTREDGTVFGAYPASEKQTYLVLEAVVTGH